MKNNLNNTAKLHTLIGQLNDYKDWGKRIIILLTGETDRNLRKQLDTYIKKEDLAGNILDEAKVTVYQKYMESSHSLVLALKIHVVRVDVNGGRHHGGELRVSEEKNHTLRRYRLSASLC